MLQICSTGYCYLLAL